MKQKHFEAANATLWSDITAILDTKEADQRPLPALYRRLCQCYALSQQRGYSPALTARLQHMVGECHRRLYGTAIERPNTLMRWMLVEFPRRVRAEWRLLLVTFIAFFGIAAGVGLLIWFKPEWAYSFASPSDLYRYREMYQPSNFAAGRGEQGDVMMFGHYVWNNVSICFRSFAGGIFGGVPALISVAFNGMHMGVIGSWLSKDPTTALPFWSFVVTHSSFELTGLLLSAMAGMRMGISLIHPGRRSRAHALQETSIYVFPIIVGAALMTFFAAFFEAFFSAAVSVPYQVKFAVGGLCWALVIGFFLFAGRSQRA